MSPRKTVLFLCTGNYYRSRFAEVIFNSLAAARGLSWQANSRALALERGYRNVGPMAATALALLRERGIELGEACTRLPVQVSLAELEQADLVIALKQDEHLPLLQERYADWTGSAEFWHIEDAPGVLEAVERAVLDLVARLQET